MNNKYTLYIISLLGTLFSGYLSGVKFFTSNCALGETCPLFLGKPACYFGFGLFLILFILSNILVFRKTGQEKTSLMILVFSILGILFAARFVISELIQWSKSGFEWSTLGLPTCAYGLIFYILALVFALRYRKGFHSAAQS